MARRSNDSNPTAQLKDDEDRPITDQCIQVPFHMSRCKTVKDIIKKRNKKIATIRAPTVFDLIRNEKDKRSHEEKAGVYRIPVINKNEDKEESYIGLTEMELREVID